MFGNGQEPPAAPETGSLWGDVFGIGSLFKVISDPALMTHAHAMMGAVIEGANANRRIEAKLDRLLGALGHEITDINSRFPAQFQSGAAPLLEQHRAHAAGGNSAAIGVADDGGSAASGGVGTAGVNPELRGRHDPTSDKA